jgi:hypothetical protein
MVSIRSIMLVSFTIVMIWLSWVLWGVPSVDAQNDIVKSAKPDQISSKSENPHFANKVLVIRLIGAFQSPWMMDRVALRKLENRSFLVGNRIDIDSKKRGKERAIWCAIDSIGVILEYSSIDEAIQAFSPDFGEPLGKAPIDATESFRDAPTPRTRKK